MAKTDTTMNVMQCHIYILQEILIPQPIAAYLDLINTVVTSSDDMVRVNVSHQALPHWGIPQDGEAQEIPPGSFGAVTTSNHNVYECYVASCITRNRREKKLLLCYMIPSINPLIYLYLNPTKIQTKDFDIRNIKKLYKSILIYFILFIHDCRTHEKFRFSKVC